MTNTLHSYRPDIDGLRAIAVLSVLFYHAFPTLLPGGFIGVDIFFVISGFLITNIVQKEIINHSFSIKNFYVRRIKRIFPALILVLLATLLVGWAVLLRHEFQQLAWHVVAGAGFFSNIALWAEADYFDRLSEVKPLLHLWSLGVEEQFYILWPLLLALVFKFKANLKVDINMFGSVFYSWSKQTWFRS
jgi:peptidoglycan/LPS O-acetylase OafA/YrhL